MEQIDAAAMMDRSQDLTQQYTVDLDAYVNEHVPITLDNAEYAARCSALMIALNRQLARCAVAFGESNNVTPEAIKTLVGGQFMRNYRMCLDAIQGEGQTAQ